MRYFNTAGSNKANLHSIKLQSDDLSLMRQIEHELSLDLAAPELASHIQHEPLQQSQSQDLLRGVDPVTVASILLVAVGAGGALTVAVSKDGFLSRLARVLEKYVDRRVDVQIDDGTGKQIKLSGAAGDIRRLLHDHYNYNGGRDADT